MGCKKKEYKDLADIQVGISVFQQPLRWIQQAVISALSQKSQYSIICTIRVDGPQGCDIATQGWLTELAEKNDRVEVIFGEKTLGTFGSYKKIFKNDASRYLCQLDADDWLEPEAIQLCIDLLERNPKASFVYTTYQEVDQSGNFLRIGTRSEKDFEPNRQLVQFNTFHLRVIRRSHYNLVGGYNETLNFTGDYDLSLKLTELAKPIYLPSTAYNYRLHTNNTSARKKEKTIKEAFMVASSALKRRELQHLWELHLLQNQKNNTNAVVLTPKKGPFVLAGMHRSGTSILALIIEKLGMDLGSDLITADIQNPDGYGEDQNVVQINRSALQRTTIQGSRGWKDWGWANWQSAVPISHADDKWRKQAQDYLKQRGQSHQFWGWKDPRNTLLLEDWLRLEPHSKVIGIYRYPWEIIEALQRLTPPIFLKEPGWCLEVWNQYNSYLLSFAEKHPERCILINSTTFINNPLALIETIQEKWGWPLKKLSSSQASSIKKLIRPDLHRGVNQHDPLIELHLACSPRSVLLLERLDQIADLPSPLKAHELASTKHKKTKSQQHPILSIIINSFNQGDLLLDALASAERHRPIDTSEIIIVDDGSSDRRTCEVLTCLQVKGYKVIRQHNQGLPLARNAGIKRAQGEFILFLDDDNRLLSPYFNEGLSIIKENPSIDVVYGNRMNFGLESKRISIGQIDEDELWAMNKIDNCALIRKTYLNRCGGYCQQLTGLGFEDWDLWLTGLSQQKSLKMKHLNQVCFEYRVRPNSMLQKLFRDEVRQQQVMRVLKERHGSKVGHGGFSQNH